MDTRKRQRGVYVSHKQKKKLAELMAKHPELVTFKVTEEFSIKDSERLWHKIADECNTLPGARKTWRQWRKTWQDMRCHAKQRERKQQEIPIDKTLPPVSTFTLAEQEALGIKNVTSTTNNAEVPEFIPEGEHNILDNFSNEISIASLSDLDSHHEEKVFTQAHKSKKNKSSNESIGKHSNDCIFNCDLLAVQEQKKLQIKEDYYTFKKDYLRQKLMLLKEQTEALKSIAKELAK